MATVVTQKDLARQLGLTQSTVSRALRGEGAITPRVRERILRAAREAGYELPGGVVPDDTALLGRRTGIICLDIPRADEWQERLMDGIIAAARETGHEVIVSAHAEESLPRVVARGQVDGLVRLMCQDDYKMGRAVGAPVPTVSILFPMPNADVVSVDHFGSARELGVHLGSLRPGIAAYVGHDYPIGQARFAGIRSGLEQWRVKLPPELVRMSYALSAGKVMPLVEELLDLRAAGRTEHQFSLIAFYNDQLARCAAKVIRGRGLRVPEDIGIAGYDDLELPVARDLKLTTVHLPLEELGAEAVRRVHWRLANPAAPPVHWILPTRVVAGNSVLKREV